MEEYQHRSLTDSIICAFYNVYNKLGFGFLEKVYENALAIELQMMGVNAITQAPISIHYEGHVVGQYFADLLVGDEVIVEVKATKGLLQEHESQLINYLKGTGKQVGLLLNFGPEPQVRRKVFSKSVSK